MPVQFARQAQRLEGRAAGEIVYAGAGRVPSQDVVTSPADRLRLLPVSEPADNCGLRKLSLRRADERPGSLGDLRSGAQLRTRRRATRRWRSSSGAR